MVYGIILAAGSGTRMKTKEKKQFLTINKKPILLYSLEKFLSIKKFDRIVLVINEKDKKNEVILNVINKYRELIHEQRIILLVGGKERYDSVYSAISFINDYFGICKNDKVLIHDSARPNVDVKDINKLITTLSKYKAISLAYRLSDSIKEVNVSKNGISKVKKSVDRDNYYLISTPQGFSLELLYNCYQKFNKKKSKFKITDDLQIIEYYSKIPTYLLDSSKLNLKITTKDDLNMLKYILQGVVKVSTVNMNL